MHPLMKMFAALQHLASLVTIEEAHSVVDTVHQALVSGATPESIWQTLVAWISNPTNIATLISIIIALIPK